MEVPLYQIFFEPTGDREPKALDIPQPTEKKLSGKDAAVVSRLAELVGSMDTRDEKLLLGIARKLTTR